jgi:hypothetical protein
MVDVKHKKCIHQNCNIRPAFNNEGEKKALYCTIHKVEGMINIKSKNCIHQDCKKIPVFNNEDEKKGLYCAKHKVEGMVDVKSKTCIHQDCKKQALFNNEGNKKALYCSKHKKYGMVNVKSNTCLDCNKQPSFNNEGETKGLYCVTHKNEGMVDIINKKCIHPNCKKKQSFNNEGETKGLYCVTHKIEGMINIISKRCKTYLCSTFVSNKYDGYCLRCFIHLFPEKPVSRNYKTKEYAVIEYIKTNFPNYIWIADKIVNGGCSKRRPDLLLDLGYQVIIVEVDENQHIDYDCSCENKRIMELSQDVGHRPIVFIRFNPDDYENNGINVTSCWGNNKNGICVVKKSKKEEWVQRLNTLEEHMNYWINPINSTNKTVETIQLFYDV